MSDAARRAMHVLLDLVASQDLGAPDEANQLASQTACEGFDRDAIDVTEDSETGEIAINPTALITAAGAGNHLASEHSRERPRTGSASDS